MFLVIFNVLFFWPSVWQSDCHPMLSCLIFKNLSIWLKKTDELFWKLYISNICKIPVQIYEEKKRGWGWFFYFKNFQELTSRILYALLMANLTSSVNHIPTIDRSLSSCSHWDCCIVEAHFKHNGNKSFSFSLTGNTCKYRLEEGNTRHLIIPK